MINVVKLPCAETLVIPLTTALALLSAVFLGAAVVTSKFALRTVDALRGTAIAIPSSMLALLVVFLSTSGMQGVNAEAVVIFAIVGLCYPALVALLRFYAIARIGAAITSSILATTTPLFALAVVVLWLREPIPGRALLASLGVVSGIFIITHRPRGQASGWSTWWLLVPFSAAAISGISQVATKAGLQLWPNPLAAALVSYMMSTLAILLFLWSKSPMPAPRSWPGISLFVGTGILNGMGVLFLFAALNSGSVALVAPLVASYPLVTLLLGGALLEEEKVTLRKLLGATLAIVSIAYLVSA